MRSLSARLGGLVVAAIALALLALLASVVGVAGGGAWIRSRAGAHVNAR